MYNVTACNLYPHPSPRPAKVRVIITNVYQLYKPKSIRRLRSPNSHSKTNNFSKSSCLYNQKVVSFA